MWYATSHFRKVYKTFILVARTTRGWWWIIPPKNGDKTNKNSPIKFILSKSKMFQSHFPIIITKLSRKIFYKWNKREDFKSKFPSSFGVLCWTILFPVKCNTRLSFNNEAVYISEDFIASNLNIKNSDVTKKMSTKILYMFVFKT